MTGLGWSWGITELVEEATCLCLCQTCADCSSTSSIERKTKLSILQPKHGYRGAPSGFARLDHKNAVFQKYDGYISIFCCLVLRWFTKISWENNGSCNDFCRYSCLCCKKNDQNCNPCWRHWAMIGKRSCWSKYWKSLEKMGGWARAPKLGLPLGEGNNPWSIWLCWRGLLSHHSHFGEDWMERHISVLHRWANRQIMFINDAGDQEFDLHARFIHSSSLANGCWSRSKGRWDPGKVVCRARENRLCLAKYSVTVYSRRAAARSARTDMIYASAAVTTTTTTTTTTRTTTTTTTTTTTKTCKKTQKMPFSFNEVFVHWEAETSANSEVFEGQVAKNTVIYSVFFTQRPKNSGICEVFSNRAA